MGTSFGSVCERCAVQSQPVFPPDVGKCRSSARQTGYRCPHPTLHQTCPASTSTPTVLPTATLRVPATFHIVVRACPPILPFPQHDLRRPLAERPLLPSRPATHAPLRHAPRLCRVPPSARAPVRQIEHGSRLAPRRDFRERPLCGPQRLCRESCAPFTTSFLT